MTASEAASLRGRMQWYATAAAGPMSSAAVQFLLSLILLARLPVAEFGRVSFLFIVSQFSVGIWSALFNSPSLVLSARAAAEKSGEGSAARELRGVRSASFFALGPTAFLFFGIAIATGLPAAAAGLFGVYGTLVLFRQSARIRAAAAGEYRRALFSDLAYSGLLLLGVAILAWLPASGTLRALVLLVAAVLGGLVPFALVGERLTLPRWRDVRGYGAVWNRDSRWSIIGVITTEATVNGHSYIVTVLLGPTAFAPIVATALFTRPVTVAINALAEFERARAAHRIARKEYRAIATARRHLRLLLLAIWLGAIVVAAAVIMFAPSEYMVDKFGLPVVVTGAVLWLAVALARLLHTAEGVILMAAGRFQQLARISMRTALVSVACVTALIFALPPVWSIAGIVVGEGLFALLAWRAAGKLLHEQSGAR